MAVFGVDFGNLHCVVSTARKGGIDIVANEVSKRETSAFVSFGEKERYLGEKAADMAFRNWQNTVVSLKRLLGVKFDSEEARHEQKFVKNQMRSDENGFIEIKVNYKFTEQWFKIEQLIGMLFTNLRTLAEKDTAEDARVEPGTIKVVDCVVSCPIFYTCLQRKLLQQAVQIAGLVPLTIMNETTAAALDWGIFKTGLLPEDEKNPTVIALVDIGQSATTVSVVSFIKGQLKVLGHLYDRYLGGRDFDYILFEHFAQEVKTKFHADLHDQKKNAIKFYSAVDKTKKVLSANQVAILSCEMGEFDVQIPNITREMIEQLFQPLLDQMKTLLQRALLLPGADRISAVELIGGGSRIPIIKQVVAEVFQKTPQTTLNASESIARGCGIMGAMLSPKFKVRDFSVIDANVFTINLAYYSEKAQHPFHDPDYPNVNKKLVLLKPGDACPKTLNLSFDRSQDFELIVFYEKDNDMFKNGSEALIGKWKVSNVPTLPEQPSVKVRLRQNPSMLISIEGATVTEEWEEEEIVEEKILKEPVQNDVKSDADKATDKIPKPEDKNTPMETDEKKEEVVKKVVKKKQTRKHDCTVNMLSSLGHTDTTLNDMKNMELQMIESDKNVHRTQEAKNSVESYIYDFRGKVGEGGSHYDFITTEDRKKFMDVMGTTEDWLYGEGDDTAKEEYIAKLVELKKFGNPVINRYNERKALPSAALSFQKTCTEFHTQSQNKDGKLSHISAEELSSVTRKCEESMKWLTTEMGKCDQTPLTKDPSLTAAAIQSKQKELETFCSPILSKPKPKEEKKEPPAPPAPTTENSAPSDANKSASDGVQQPGNKMDLD